MSTKISRIRFWIGTEAELIKLFPVMLEMEKRNLKFDILATGQNPIEKSELLGLLKTRPHLEQLSDGPAKKSTMSLLSWFIKTLLRSVFSLPSQKDSVLLIHGDTVSTLMGALVGFFKRYKVGHIEAGLRSFNFLRPFPEEICRVISSKMVSYHFCPNERALLNIQRTKGAKINTRLNTLYDSLNIFKSFGLAARNKTFDKYFVFVLHRQENVYDHEFVKSLTRLIIEKSETIPCVFILHELTRQALEQLNLLDLVRNSKCIITFNRLPYFEFMNVLSKAEFLITDGGSNQEESFYMGLPCLVMRSETERSEGIGSNVQLAGKDLAMARGYFDNYQKYRFNVLRTSETPSSIIVNFLEHGTADA